MLTDPNAPVRDGFSWRWLVNITVPALDSVRLI